MEGHPPEIDQEIMIKGMKNLKDCNVTEVYDYHLWQMSVGKYAFSAHVVSSTPDIALRKLTEFCKKKYDIRFCTL